MGGPITVVYGRIEYLLDQTLDQKTRFSLTANLRQADQLIALRKN